MSGWVSIIKYICFFCIFLQGFPMFLRFFGMFLVLISRLKNLSVLFSGYFYGMKKKQNVCILLLLHCLCFLVITWHCSLTVLVDTGFNLSYHKLYFLNGAKEIFENFLLSIYFSLTIFDQCPINQSYLWRLYRKKSFNL